MVLNKPLSSLKKHTKSSTRGKCPTNYDNEDRDRNFSKGSRKFNMMTRPRLTKESIYQHSQCWRCWFTRLKRIRSAKDVKFILGKRADHRIDYDMKEKCSKLRGSKKGRKRSIQIQGNWVVSQRFLPQSGYMDDLISYWLQNSREETVRSARRTKFTTLRLLPQR